MTEQSIKLFLDMDNVLVDTLPVLNRAATTHRQRPDTIPGIFRDLPPISGVLAAIPELAKSYDLYILSTAPWNNPSAWQDKLLWIQQYFGAGDTNYFYKKVIMTHDKGLVRGASGILLDDRPYHGASAWDDPQHGSFWIQYGYDSRLTWSQDLVPMLEHLAYDSQRLGSLSQAMQQAATNYQLHGDHAAFTKENWE
ncbi:5' nucleotidase, NT5C type [Fructilactobacillus florum]|nr:hypothetical protein [Fructilactobacillus florum]EKK20950.1 5'(3')-deoxyribonucleotidase [Fructilactobacillus florum 2F]